MKKTTYEHKKDERQPRFKDWRQPRFMTYTRVGRLSEQAALMEKQRKIMREFVQQVGGAVARSWEVEGGADSRAGKAAKQEMLDYAKQNAGRLDGLLVCGVDRLTRQGPQVGAMFSAELAKAGVKLVSLPTVLNEAGWAQVSEALDWLRAKAHRDDNKLHGPQRVVAVLRASAREPVAGHVEGQRKQLEAYAHEAGLELEWLPSDQGSE